MLTTRRFVSVSIVLGLLAAGLGLAATNDAPVDEKNIEQILKAVSPSVVKVEVRNGVRRIATGVVINKDGTIVTTALISPRDEKITILTFEGKQLSADFKGFDTSTGLAVIQVKDKGLPAIALGKTADARPGAWTAAVTFSPENTPAVTQGIVSSATEDRIRLNLWVMPGASGGPIVNSEGRLTGVLRGSYIAEQPVVIEFQDRQYAGSGTIISRAEAPSSGMAVAVPVDLVLSVAGDIMKNGKVLRGWMGFDVLEAEGRLEIVGITPRSPAELAKLKTGDMIVRLDGKDISSGMVMTQEIRKRKPGTEIVLGIKRDGADKDVRVKLGEYPEEEGRIELETRFPSLFPQMQPPSRSFTPRRNLEDFFTVGSQKYVGAKVQELTKELAEYFGSKDGKGLLVGEVNPGGPAEKAGIKVGDVLVKADGKALEFVTDLTEIIEAKKKGEKIKVEILRDKKALTIEVTVAEDTSSPADRDAALRALQEYQTALSDRQYNTEIRDKLARMTETVAKGKSAKGPVPIVTRKGIYYQI